MGNKSKITDKLKNFFVSKENIEMAFLFGSEAKERAIGESDVDIAVWFSDEYDSGTIDGLWKEIELLLHRNIDLVILNQARPTVAWAAMRGVPLIIKSYSFFIEQMLLLSDEAEFVQDLTLDIFALRQKYREAA